MLKVSPPLSVVIDWLPIPRQANKVGQNSGIVGLAIEQKVSNFLAQQPLSWNWSVSTMCECRAFVKQ